MTIYINTKAHEWIGSRIKYSTVLSSAHIWIPYHEHPEFEISYRIKKGAAYEEGYLLPRSSIKVTEGMEFTVTIKNEKK